MMMMVRVGMVGMLELAVVTVRNDVGRSAVGAAAVHVAVVGGGGGVSAAAAAVGRGRYGGVLDSAVRRHYSLRHRDFFGKGGE